MGGRVPVERVRAHLWAASVIVALVVAACAAPAAPPAAQPSKPAAPSPAVAPPETTKPAAPAPAPAVAPAKPAAQPAQAPAKPAQMEKVKFGHPFALNNLVVYAAKELGYYAQEGIDAELIDLKSGGEVTSAMLGKSIDVSVTQTDRALLLAEKGQQTKNLVSTMNRTLQTLLVRQDVDVAYGDLKALKGRKLGITGPGSGSDIVLRYLLKTAGLDADKDVTIISVGLPNYVSALQAKQVEGIQSVEPATSQLVHTLKIGKPVLDVAKDGPGLMKNIPWLSLQATSEWIDSHKETTKKIIRVQVRASKDFRADPAKAIEVGKKLFANVDPALVEIIVKQQLLYSIPEITEDEVKAIVQLYKEIGLMTKDIPYEAVTVSKEFRDLWK